MPTASWRRGGVVTQRIANPCTPVRFRPSPPLPFKHLRATFVCAAYWCVCNPVRIVHAVLPSDRRCSPRPILGPGKRPHPARSSQQVAGPRRRGARGALPGPVARRRGPQGKGGAASPSVEDRDASALDGAQSAPAPGRAGATRSPRVDRAGLPWPRDKSRRPRPQVLHALSPVPARPEWNRFRSRPARVTCRAGQIDRPSTCLAGRARGSTPSRQLTLTATIGVPSGIAP